MAGNKILFLATIFCSVSRTVFAVSTQITINPQNLVLGVDAVSTGGNVTVKCKVLNMGSSDALSTLWITRELAGSDTPQTLVTASTTSTGLTGPSLSGMTATGGISDKSLTLNMAATTCDDERNYTCNAFVLQGGTNPQQYIQTGELTVEVSPGLITLFATPSDSSYTVNDSLSMLCNGPVGTVTGSTQLSWVWQYSDGFGWNDLGNSDGHIEDVDTPVQQTCYQTRQSRLTRNLTLADSGRIYRCLVRRGSTNYPQFAGNYTVQSVTEVTTTTTVSTPAGTSTADVGLIVGVVIAVLVVVIVIIVIVVFVMKRRKASREESEEDAGNKPADDPNGPAFTTDPGVMYSQPNRFRNDRHDRNDRNDREAGEDRERERGRGTNAEGLHYADLDLVRNPPNDGSAESVHSRTTPTTPTEYASIRLY